MLKTLITDMVGTLRDYMGDEGIGWSMVASVVLNLLLGGIGVYIHRRAKVGGVEEVPIEVKRVPTMHVQGDNNTVNITHHKT